MTEFVITTEYIELLGLLKATGLAMTGGHAKMLVEDGEVMVNGEVESRKRRKLRAGDVVQVSNSQVRVLNS
ncbi:MAG: RNA-binding S4 domain-containing protein [Flavobacteriales bacterium]|nr:RNA-binding S4 domain-containing protein [Flavobacteriales bacterium]